MKEERQIIKQALLKGNYIEEKEFNEALKESNKRKVDLVDYLVYEEVLTPDLFGQAMAEFFELGYADLNSKQPSQEQIDKIKEQEAKKYRIVLFEEDDKKITIATDQPSNKKKILLKLKKIFPKKKINIAYSLTADINDILNSYRKKLETRFSKIISNKESVAPEIIDEILNDAVSFKASDIHFEPQEKEVVVRFRVDGVLQEAGRVGKEYYENIINRLKVQARLKIDEHYATQDGAIRFNFNERRIDARMSIIPTLNGEKIVLRLLADYMRNFGLSEIGLLPNNQKLLDKAASKSFGMILVTGPTGSGKTTTLYAVLQTLNSSEVNITTIEDPVEFRVARVNQIQVNKQTDLTFAKGLRSIVRQDPDIILVGEIRDQETAEIAVNAALTGHLLLSTFHSNDAATAIPRLIDMGVEPFLLASTLEVIVAQRLARRICESCRHSYTEDIKKIKERVPSINNYINNKKNITLYKGKGCHRCSGTGYKGRIGIFEFIEIDSDLENLILENPSSQQIWDVASKNGAISLFEDGLEKVKNGLTTIDELLRIANVPYEEKSKNEEKSKDKKRGKKRK